MSVLVSVIYSRKVLIDGETEEIFNTDIETLIMQDANIGKWNLTGNIKTNELIGGNYKQLPDKYTTIKKQWAVLINSQVFRICSNQSEADEVRAKVIKTIDQVKDLGNQEEISYVNLFNLSSTQLQAEQPVKRVNLD
tara:strand:+ start:476 stop:886 length:411 start_codon:yes stop_codon:yes gene_type:complete